MLQENTEEKLVILNIANMIQYIFILKKGWLNLFFMPEEKIGTSNATRKWKFLLLSKGFGGFIY